MHQAEFSNDNRKEITGGAFFMQLAKITLPIFALLLLLLASASEAMLAMLVLLQKQTGAHALNGLGSKLLNTLKNNRYIANYSSEISLNNTIGRGSFGDVYSGSFNGEEVAIKVIRSSSTNNILAEAWFLDKMRESLYTPNLIAICDNKIVMELLKGKSLDKLLNSNTALPWGKRIEIARGIALGVNELHGNSIIHRDLKSANILLSLPGFKPKITDFGTAVFIGEGSIQDEEPGPNGTILWMPPESFTGTYNKRTDVYSLGMVFLEIASRNRPYSSVLDLLVPEIRVMKIQSSIRPSIPYSCPPNFAKTIKKCWGEPKRPDSRIAAKEAVEMLYMSNSSKTGERSCIEAKLDISNYSESSGYI